MNIQNKKEFSLPFFGRDLKFIFSNIANQTNASVIGQYGETVVLVTVVMGKEDRNIDYFPLTVDYEERFYAAGKVLGSRFIRREGRPSDFAVLSGRLIDRTVRPLFDQRLRRDVQVVVTILSYDEENDPDFIALNTASLALAASNIPWNGPVSGIRILKTKDGFVFNPLNSEKNGALKEEGNFEAFFSGTDQKINMIELEGNNALEEDVENAFLKSFEEIKKLIAFQNQIVKEVGQPKLEVALFEIDSQFNQAIRDFAKGKLEEALYLPSKTERNQSTARIKEELINHLTNLGFENFNGLEIVWENLIDEIIHENILNFEKRPDGRKLDEIRPIEAYIGLFKRLHGSALFIRGETQSLAVTTLAAPGSEQLVETMEISTKRRFIFHYNFPPYSTGEIGKLGMPGRREIGHGALAEKALRNVIPSQEEFPYTIRVVSEILSSNGSSSMASTCAGSLSLMDAGVPIKKAVAGIAMGLITNQKSFIDEIEQYKILTDIQGPEDHYGDMDLKVAGTKDGITAIQMDVKISGINLEIFSKALKQAKKARLQILEVMEKAIAAPRPQISPYAPIILTLEVKPYQIGSVIGPGGKVINKIIEDFGLESIDIDESGRVYVSANSLEKAQKAVDFIRGMTHEFTIGEVVEGEVIKILDFGAIVDLGGGRDGMIHISELKNGFVQKVNDVIKLGERVKAKIIKIEENGRIALSLKALSQ